MGNTRDTGFLRNIIAYDASGNVGIGGTVNASYKVTINGTSLHTGASVFSGFVGINGSPATAFPLEAYINSSTAYTTSSRGNVMRVYNSNTGANIFAGIELGGAGAANDGLAGLNAVVTGSGSAALTFYTRDGGTFAERMRISSNGNVGIGLTPSYAFDVANSSSPSIRVRNGALGGTATLLLETANDFSGTCQAYVRVIGSTGNGNSTLTFGTAGGIGDTTATERMRITSAGNIGIGTSSPSYKLDIRNDVAATTSLEPISIGLYNGNDGGSAIYFRNSVGGQSKISFGVQSSGSGTDDTYLAFSTGGNASLSERMRITSGGEIQVKQASNSFTGGFGTINLSGNIWSILSGGDNNFYFGFNYSALGYFSSSTGNYVALSDINKKKDFEESTIGLNAIMGLKPTLYRMASEDDSVEKHLGFIAQEVKEFIPQAYSETGNFIGLEDRPIIAALVKAIQEQQSIIETQEQRISYLENK